jgi:uncharacterized repeat protein (TIGR01451 family)
LTKRFTDDPVPPGGTVTLEFTLLHSPEATSDATGIGFTDDLTALGIAGLTVNLPPSPDPPCGAGSSLTAPGNVLTLTGGSLTSGGSCTFSVTLDLPALATPGNYTNTTGVVSATVAGLAVTSAAASDLLNVSGLTFTKEFTNDPVIAGGTVTMRFTIDNIHPTDDATDIVFNDDLAAVLPGVPDLTIVLPPAADTCGGTMIELSPNFLNYSNGSVAAGVTCTIDVDVLVPAGAVDGRYSNTTSNLSATQGGPVVVDPAVDFLVVNSNRLSLIKFFTDDPVAPGDNVTLEFNLTNLDAGQPASGIGFTDDLGAALAGLTFDSVLLDTCGGTVSGTGTTLITVSGVSLAASGSCTIQASLTVPGAAAPGIYPNTTSGITGTISGFAVAGDAASDNLEVLNLLQFSKSFNGPTTATGAPVLTFTITNPGPTAVSGIAFTDNLDAVISGLIATGLPANPCGIGSNLSGISFLTLTGASLPPMGGTCSFDVELLVPATATAGIFPNTTSDLFQSGLTVAPPAGADLVVEPAPVFAKSFAPGTINPGAVSTLTFTIDNTASALTANALAFSDNLPAGMVVAAPDNASTTCTGGTLTAVSGSASIDYGGGGVSAGASCTIQVDVTGGTPGALLNTSGDLTSSSGNSGTASATLIVNALNVLTFGKAFAPASIDFGATSTLTFTIDNTANLVAATGLDFTDNLPAGIVVATPSNASTTCSGGILTATDGAAVISYTGGAAPAGTTCTVQADVIGTATATNTSGDLTSSAGNSGPATATLTVGASTAPTFNKTFDPDRVAMGSASTMTFTIDNSASLADATNLAFSDNLPAGMQVADPSFASTTCIGGSLSAVPGSTVVSYSGGSVAAGASCEISVQVITNSPGAFTNTTETLSSNLGTSPPASATLNVTADVAAVDVPTLQEWGYILLVGLLLISAVRRLRILGAG